MKFKVLFISLFFTFVISGLVYPKKEENELIKDKCSHSQDIDYCIHEAMEKIFSGYIKEKSDNYITDKNRFKLGDSKIMKVLDNFNVNNENKEEKRSQYKDFLKKLRKKNNKNK